MSTKEVQDTVHVAIQIIARNIFHAVIVSEVVVVVVVVVIIRTKDVEKVEKSVLIPKLIIQIPRIKKNRTYTRNIASFVIEPGPIQLKSVIVFLR